MQEPSSLAGREFSRVRASPTSLRILLTVLQPGPSAAGPAQRAGLQRWGATASMGWSCPTRREIEEIQPRVHLVIVSGMVCAIRCMVWEITSEGMECCNHVTYLLALSAF